MNRFLGAIILAMVLTSSVAGVAADEIGSTVERPMLKKHTDFNDGTLPKSKSTEQISNQEIETSIEKRERFSGILHRGMLILLMGIVPAILFVLFLLKGRKYPCSTKPRNNKCPGS